MGDRSVRNPGMVSSLSKVPPVWPNPRPEIMGTLTPQAATNGARINDTLSPTPPVLCLSTLTPRMDLRSITRPELIMHLVRWNVSSSFMPLRKTAIRSAEAW